MNVWRPRLVLLCVGVFLFLAYSCGSQKKTASKRKPAQRTASSKPRSAPPSRTTRPGATPASSVLIRYATKLGVPASDLKNEKLYSFVDQWAGTPYKYGGTDHRGVDCSGFVGTLFREVYKKNLPRTTRDQRTASIKVSKNDLREGDLVFFNISGKDSHVGVYLANNHFVHASTSKGVIISNLTNPYYQKVFAEGGRY